jgi:glycosyltransferase involved in cell wall biosynthesis
MAHRLPIVATDVGYLKTIVRESGGGILVSPGNVEDLAQAIARLVNDPDYRRQLGENGRFYAQRFAWPNIIAKLLQFYERVITKTTKVSL